MSRNTMRVISISVLMTAALFLCGCSQQSYVAADTEKVDANRQYMSDVNQDAQELYDKLGIFSEAVAREDLVSMRTQSEAAYQVIDHLNSLEVPEDLTELSAGYQEACADLKEALGAYIDLYSDISTQNEQAPFDYSTYAQRIEDVQNKYTEGIELLQSTDQKATELQK